MLIVWGKNDPGEAFHAPVNVRMILEHDAKHAGMS
jgi:hypothetical protein